MKNFEAMKTNAMDELKTPTINDLMRLLVTNASDRQCSLGLQYNGKRLKSDNIALGSIIPLPNGKKGVIMEEVEKFDNIV